MPCGYFLRIKKKTQGNSGKFKVTQGSFWSLRGDFLTQRVATLHKAKFALVVNSLKLESYFFCAVYLCKSPPTKNGKFQGWGRRGRKCTVVSNPFE